MRDQSTPARITSSSTGDEHFESDIDLGIVFQKGIPSHYSQIASQIAHTTECVKMKVKNNIIILDDESDITQAVSLEIDDDLAVIDE